MMKPIVFLDIDGVARPVTKPNDYKLNPQNVALLNLSFDVLDAEVVISSNWRLTHSLDFFNEYFDGRVTGKTRDLEYKGFEFTRWEEILHFMKNHIGRNFFVLDDQSYHFPSGAHQLILCDESKGFTLQHFDRLVTKFENRKKY
jgi:hypothetical protein